MSVTLFLVVISILCAGICYSVAKSKGANVPFWVLMAALFGPLAIPFVFFAKPTVEIPK